MYEVDSVVVPLDIRLLRKTQRRVTALLQSSRAAGNPFATKQKRTGLTQGRRQVCGKLGDLRQDEDKWGSYPRPPNPSAASRQSSHSGYGRFDQHEDIRHLLDTLRLPSIQRDQLTGGRDLDQYQDHRLLQHRLAAPLLDDTSRVKSLGKHSPDARICNGDVAVLLKLPRVDAHKRKDADQHDRVAIEDSIRFPEIDKVGSLVATSRETSDTGDRQLHKGSYSERRLSPIKDSAMERNFSFVSERTGGSLRIDEEYVPMSITITKLSEGDLQSERTSEQNSLSSGHQNWTSEKSRQMSETDSNPASQKRFTERAYARNHESPNFPGGPLARPESSGWCTCSLGTRAGGGVSSAPCPECRRVDAHEKWCVSASGLCQLCRKPVKKLSTRRQQQPGDLRDTSGNEGREEAIGSLESDYKRARKQVSNSDRQKQRALRDTFERELNHASPDRQQNQRVRFDPADSPGKPNSTSALFTGAEDSGVTVPERNDAADKGEKKQKAAGDTADAKQPSEKSCVKIPKLGVSVHKTAYILALRDSMEQNTKKPKTKRKQREPSESKGTVFSYFTLLRRPHSDPPQSLNLGIKQDFGVVPRDGMKHVFGKIKLADYYPGGKRWKELYDDH